MTFKDPFVEPNVVVSISFRNGTAQTISMALSDALLLAKDHATMSDDVTQDVQMVAHGQGLLTLDLCGVLSINITSGNALVIREIVEAVA